MKSDKQKTVGKSKRKGEENRKKFTDAILLDPTNATAAAEAAGYAHPSIAGARLMKRPEVQEALAGARKECSQRVNVTLDRIVEEIANVAFSDPRSVMSWNSEGVTIKPSSQLTAAEAACVSKVTETRAPDGSVIVKVELHDRNAAHDKLMRYLGGYKDKLEVTGNLELGARLDAARKRAGGGK